MDVTSLSSPPRAPLPAMSVGVFVRYAALFFAHFLSALAYALRVDHEMLPYECGLCSNFLKYFCVFFMCSVHAGFPAVQRNILPSASDLELFASHICVLASLGDTCLTSASASLKQ
mgnify:CR=1 FL=1